MNKSKAKPALKAPAGNISHRSSVLSSRLKNTNAVGSRSNLFASSSRKSVVIDAKSDKSAGFFKHKPAVQVLDDMGQDVTPRSLLKLDPNVIKRHQSTAIFGGESIATPSDMTQSIYAASNASYYGGFSRFGGSSVSGRSSPESILDDLSEHGGYHQMSTGLGEVQTRYDVEEEDLSEADLEKMVNITLEETETIWLLDMPGTCVAQDSEIAQGVKERNATYEEILKNRPGNEIFVERGMQTFNNDPKNKGVQTTKVENEEVGCMATTWDMYDTYNELATNEDAKEGETEQTIGESLSRPSSAHPRKEGKGSASSSQSRTSKRRTSAASGSINESKASMFTESSRSEAQLGKSEDAEEQQIVQEDLESSILKSENLKNDLFVMERVLTLNMYQPRQALYRGFTVYPDIDKQADESAPEETVTTAVSLAQLGPNLNKLWQYSCPLTKGRNVSCLAWNRLNNDILAVGYGEFVYTEQKGGLLCCWSIKNPEYPERVYHLSSGVTSLCFSSIHPNLLAVGLYDGTIAIFNVRNTRDAPVLDSMESQGKHIGPVWQVKWVLRDQGTGEEKDEVLMSISADGRVTKWSIRKGFECADLMKLKRVSVAKDNKAKAEGTGGGGSQGTRKSDALISRFAAGFCFDCHPKDSNIYIAGTEEGNIHKCSCSYNEQYLDSYYGHTGPVYKASWSPFNSDAFLTCSADWSIRLWHQDRPQPVLTFLSSTKSVNDISWSPTNPTMFGCVNDGAIEIWDLNLNSLDPIVVHVPVQDVKLSTILFSLNSETILVGDNEGNVSVYELRAMPLVTDNHFGILQKLIAPVKNNQHNVSITEEEEVER